jgi:FdhD protein
MPQSEGAAAINVEARSFSYDAGAVGSRVTKAIAVEAPIEIVIGGTPYVVMMATPCDLEDFVYGFLMTEGVARRPDDIRGVETGPTDGGWRIDVALSAGSLQAHLARKRAISGRTGCGLCGVEDLKSLPAPQTKPSRRRPIKPAAIGAAVRDLERHQPLNAETRAVHAAGWCDGEGRIVLMREDVGRHNALDKAIGALWRDGVDPEGGFFLVTSRCSFELVAKVAIFGARTLVSLSAATSFALEKSREFGIEVIAVARADKALSFAADCETIDGGIAA